MPPEPLPDLTRAAQRAPHMHAGLPRVQMSPVGWGRLKQALWRGGRSEDNGQGGEAPAWPGSLAGARGLFSTILLARQGSGQSGRGRPWGQGREERQVPCPPESLLGAATAPPVCPTHQGGVSTPPPCWKRHLCALKNYPKAANVTR